MSDLPDSQTQEQLWQDPPWYCPNCDSVNRAIRSRCRVCGCIGGEVAIADVMFLEVKSEVGGNDED